MNALLKKRVAKVGDEPAVTKIQQKLYLGKNIGPGRHPGHAVAEDRASQATA